jgi:2-polyprenyl-3-methyl-5-hydroxy-6-metoxy-1,4-benzoquinol methylase
VSVASHYDGSASTYADQYDESKIWTNEEYPANYFRLKLVRNILANAGVKSRYEPGVGDATPLVAIAGDGIRVASNDVSPEMVKFARANMAKHGLDTGTINLLDVQSQDAIDVERERAGEFEAVMALGVIPHVEDDRGFVASMDKFMAPGGRMLLQFRNSMFSMFTFNRLTKEFVMDQLLPDVPLNVRLVVEADLNHRLAVDKPPKRTRPSGDGYDEILSRFHNPFELSEIVKSFGYQDLQFHWYNYHPAYPMLSGEIDPKVYRQAQMDLEGDTSWRGMFVCSAGLIEAIKA